MKHSKVSGAFDRVNFSQLAVMALGGAVSTAVITPIVKALDKDRKYTYAGPIAKIGLGLAALLYSNNEMLEDAGLGMIAVGAYDAAQIAMPETFSPKLAGIGSTIDLNAFADRVSYNSNDAVRGYGKEYENYNNVR